MSIHAEASTATMVAPPGEQATMLTAEQVAAVVAGIPVIGRACDALKNAGYYARIAGNRITVNDEMFAQFIGALGNTDATWVIYTTGGAAPVWVGGSEPQR
jgi:hypothetical protein